MSIIVNTKLGKQQRDKTLSKVDPYYSLQMLRRQIYNLHETLVIPF